jgi:hypothetical protein
MMSKQEQLDRIKELDLKIKRLSKQNEMGPILDKLLIEVIDLEEDYKKRHGRDPNGQI